MISSQASTSAHGQAGGRHAAVLIGAVGVRSEAFILEDGADSPPNAVSHQVAERATCRTAYQVCHMEAIAGWVSYPGLATRTRRSLGR
jgi:hypothetical protein